MTRIAAIDCGTNSIRLLVADADPATGELVDLDRRMTIVRLGQGVDRTGRLAPEALERTFAACREYAQIIKDHGAEKVRFVATSASRDAENRDEFVSGVLDILGVEPEVISGDQEAEFSFTGATKELAGDEKGAERLPWKGGGGRRAGEDYLVADIGGGSTELVTGRDTVQAARSVDIGCVRLTERHQPSSPATPEQVAAIREDIEAALDLAARTVPFAQGPEGAEGSRTLVGLAGSVTTVAAIALGLDTYDPSAIHHARIPYERVREVTEMLIGATHDEKAAIPVMHPGRVDVIVAGSLILLALMERAGAAEVVVSEHDILDGIGWSVA
ncbi:exopolyphosphatase [Streptomyces sp. NPDC021093]|uniref:Ppx/GppA phosphatase family protein n=1 Tax=Streptomyces sp. NPDC021093 TaxID=3365112 RepID=UPI0037AD691E